MNNMKTLKTFFSPEKLTSFILYFSIFAFIIAFNFSDHGGGGWQLQNLPFLNDRPLRDMTFTDSLTGYGITKGGNGDSDYVIKTSNGGNNWSIMNTFYAELNQINFINSNTGFICGGDRLGHSLELKTTNGGSNWFSLNASFANQFRGMFVLNEDTIWLVDDNGFNGGVFRTVNGGNNWILQFFGYNPSKIYMVNKDIGFINGSGGRLMKTINGGFNWKVIPGQDGFVEMFFVDSLKGWKSYDSMKMTTDGGITWKRQNILVPNSLMTGSFASFSNIGKDTIWAGGVIYQFFPNLQSRGVVHFTTNEGLNWFFQIPDTSFRLPGLYFSNFFNYSTGWEYSVSKGIQTKTGGDSFFSPITKIKDEIIYTPENFNLYQNYPNPFNPKTKILYKLNYKGRVLLKVYNSLGIEIATLMDQNQNLGEHKVDFDGSGYSNGVYFYSLFIDNVRMDTKKMVLLK